MDSTERYFWDLTGFLVVRNVLTSEEITDANRALDCCQDLVPKAKPDAGSKNSKSLAGTPKIHLQELLDLPEPHCQPFRDLIVHPAVVSRLNVICGKRFRLDHGPLLIGGVEGTEGLTLHGAGEPHVACNGYHHQNNVTYCGGVTVAWQLNDVNPGDGGFVCVPGSHKSRYPVPPGVRTCDDDLGVVFQPAMKAGDVLFFMDGAATHGTHAWTSKMPRRSILIKYASESAVRGTPRPDLYLPEVWWGGDVVEGMTDPQRAVMSGPGAHHRGIVKALIVDDDGTVRTEE